MQAGGHPGPHSPFFALFEDLAYLVQGHFVLVRDLQQKAAAVLRQGAAGGLLLTVLQQLRQRCRGALLLCPSSQH